MVTCEIKPTIGVDGDNTLWDTCKKLREFVELKAPGQYSEYHFNPRTPDEKFPKEFLKLRSAFMANPSHVLNLSFFPDVNLSLEMLQRHFDDVLLITARLDLQKLPIHQLLNGKQLLSHLTAMMLRPEDKEPELSKFENAMNAGIRYMVDDDKTVAFRLALEGIDVAMLDRTWNQGVVSSKNLIRFGQLIDFAVAATLFGSPEELFEYHYVHRLRRQADVQPPWIATPEERLKAIDIYNSKLLSAHQAYDNYLADMALKNMHPNRNLILTQ